MIKCDNMGNDFHTASGADYYDVQNSERSAHKDNASAFVAKGSEVKAAADVTPVTSLLRPTTASVRTSKSKSIS